MPGWRLRRFSITVGPYLGKYKRCGSYVTSVMYTAKTRSFSCGDEAFGTSVQIKLEGIYDILTLCEVHVYGRGKIELLIICHLGSINSTFAYMIYHTFIA